MTARAEGTGSGATDSIRVTDGDAVSVDELIARTLRIPLDHVRGDLHYHAIVEWDSFAHADLMGALEREHETTIDADLTLTLTSVEAIRSFARSHERARDGGQAKHATGSPHVPRGLRNVVIDETQITQINGTKGLLRYRGYDAFVLARTHSFEDVLHLLVHGDLPTPERSADFAGELWAAGGLPAEATDAVRSAAPVASAVEALCVGVSALRTPSGVDPHGVTYQDALRAVTALPHILAIYHAARTGGPALEPVRDQSYAANLLRLLLQRQPSDEDAALVNQLLVLHADHDLNAATFALRVTVGAGGGAFLAFVAALATFAGHLHGGAIEAGARMLSEFELEETGAFVDSVRSAGRPLYGFGSGIYRCPDPRAVYMLELARARTLEPELQVRLRKIDALVAAFSEQARHGLGPNDDLPTGLLYASLGLPEDLFIAIYACGRAAGWAAHALEQSRNNVLIRPTMRYVGPPPRNPS